MVILRIKYNRAARFASKLCGSHEAGARRAAKHIASRPSLKRQRTDFNVHITSPSERSFEGEQTRRARESAVPPRQDILLIFQEAKLGECTHLPQAGPAQELQVKAEARLATLMQEKLVTRISLISTLLGGGKTTERLLVRISV